MLLSVPTWIIHLLTVSEWLTAIVLIRRYAMVIEHSGLRLFAYAMLPHLFGGLMVLAFHVSGDQTRELIDASRVLTFIGSLSLLTATLLILRPVRAHGALLPALVIGTAIIWAVWRVLTTGSPAALLPGTNVTYLVFLVALLAAYRRDPALFSPISVFGFWFLLVFVAVTITATYIATERLGLPSLTHADLLHGGSESFLSISNLLIAIGAYRRLKQPASPHSGATGKQTGL